MAYISKYVLKQFAWSKAMPLDTQADIDAVVERYLNYESVYN